MTSELFAPIQMGRFHAKNRFVRSATKEELCDRDGHIPEELLNIYRRFAKGGVGTIIVSSARVRLFDGTPHGGLMRLDRPELLDEYKALAATGRENDTTMLIQATYTHRDIDKLTLADMDAIVEEHVQAARFAEAAGFDGIQFHQAHDMFLNQILSPKFNHRTDAYGENKNLLAERIVTAVRQSVGPEFILINKVNCQDFEEGRQTEEDSLGYCKDLAGLGLDAIEVSGNRVIQKVNQKEDESYFHGFASRLRKEIEIPVILVGGNRSLDVMDRLYQEEGIDMFSMSRALTCEPELIQRWQSGDTEDGHCRYCNACLKTHAHQCVFNLKNNERAQL